MKIIKGATLLLWLLIGVNVSGQELTESEEKEIIDLYTKHYAEWVSSSEIQQLIEKHPEIEKLIKTIPITQTEAYKEALRESNKPVEYLEIFGNKGIDLGLEFFKEILDPKYTDVILRMHWRIIESSESKEIAQLVLQHMQRAQSELEDAITTHMPKSKFD